MPRVLAGGLIAVGIGLMGYALLSSQTDEEVMVQKLTTLADAVGIRQGEGLLFRRARLNAAFEDVLADAITVHVPDFGLPQSGRNDVVMLATRAGTYFASGTVELDDIEVVHEPSAPTASATAVATLNSTRGSRGLRQDTRAVKFGFVLEDGEWLVDRVLVESTAATH